MSDTNNVKSSQDNNSQNEKSKPQPPKTPDIEFTRTYQRNSDGVTREYLLERKKQATATKNLKSSQDNNSQNEKSKPQPPKTPNVQFTRTYQRNSDGVTREYLSKRKKQATATKDS